MDAVAASRRARRFVADEIQRVPDLGSRAAHTKQAISDKLIEHQQHIEQYGDDVPEVRDWMWSDV